jgi:hypothetical protein
MTYMLARIAGAHGAAWSALLLEILITAGFTFLAWKQVLSQMAGYNVRFKLRESKVPHED